jgi:hypothetical protein
VRSYRDVVDVVERRIFRIDRWRLPTPHGVSVRAIAYAAACLAAVLVVGGLPGFGDLLARLPPSLRYLALPAVAGAVLSALSIDGRAPHRALFAAARHRLAPRSLAGLREAPALGARMAPVVSIQIAPSEDEARYRPGRVRGPATLTLRYPAELAVERRRGRRTGEGASRFEAAKRLRVRGLEGRPLARGHQIRVPDGAEVRFE